MKGLCRALLSIAVLLLPGLTGEVDAAKRALVVGIDAYRNLPVNSARLGREMRPLKGAVNDARGFADALQRNFGFAQDDVRTLINEAATKDGILSAFREWLVRETRAGDVVVFFFSGHGTSVPDENGDEDDGQDEALCPYDMVPTASSIAQARLILDDELGALFAQLPGREVVVVVDACHSGTITRSIGGQVVSQLEPTPATELAKFVWLDNLQRTRGGGPQAKTVGTAWELTGTELVFTSCRANQVSIEIRAPGGSFHGAFTSALIERMNRLPVPTYGELLIFVSHVVRDRYRLVQEPELQPERAGMLDALAFGKAVAASRPTTAVPAAQPPSALPSPPVARPAGASPAPADGGTGPLRPSSGGQGAVPSLLATGAAPQSSRPGGGEKLLLRVDEMAGATPAVVKRLRERFASIPYVEVTDGAFFDRLVRGRVSAAGACELRLVNSAGDAVLLRQAGSIREAVELAAPHLEYAFIAKQLAVLWTLEPAFKAGLSTVGERRDFRVGERLVLEITAQQDCYVLLFNVDSMANAHLVFPNRYSQENFVKAGTRVEVPSEAMRKNDFELQFFPPAGEETFALVATTLPLDLDRLAGGHPTRLLDPVSGSPLSSTSASRELAARLLAMLGESVRAAGAQWSRDLLVLRSHPQ